MREGKRTAVEVPHVAPGDLPSTLAPRQGEEAIATPDGGSLIYRTARLDAREARKVVRNPELRAQALGYGAYTPPELADRVVILRSRVGELMTARANAATEPQVVAALKAQASPGDVVLVRHGEQGRQYAEDLRTASRNSDAATAREAEGKGWQAKASIDPAELEALAARSGDFHLPSTADSHRAVTAPDGSKFWGRITPEMSAATNGRLKPLPIIVKAGSNLVDVQAGKGDNSMGFGYVHLHRHGKHFIKQGLSTSQFLDQVLRTPDELYRTEMGRIMLVKQLKKKNGAVVTLLTPSGDAYSATTAFVERANHDWTQRNKLLWKRSEPASPSLNSTLILPLGSQQGDHTRPTPLSQDGNASGSKAPVSGGDAPAAHEPGSDNPVRHSRAEVPFELPGAPRLTLEQRQAENAQLLTTRPSRRSPPSNTARVRDQDEHGQTIRKGLLLADHAHDDGQLPPVDFGSEIPPRPEGDVHGDYHSGDRSKAERALGRVRLNTGRTLNITLHEFGHHISSHVLTAGELKEVHDAARDTLAYERIAGAKMLPEEREYLLDPHEIFSRAYAQYVAEKTGDAEALSELARMSKSDKVGNRVWSKNDFKRVFSTIDKIFKSKGWL